MQEENVITKIPKDGFLLSKQHGYGFWSDMHDVWAKLLLAEITNREPIIYWGKDSLYSVDENHSSFEQYFLPVSDYSMDDVVNEKYTYFPFMWNPYNLFQTDPTRHLRVFQNIDLLINSDADVLVCDTYNFVHNFMPWIKEGHPAYGLDEDAIYRYMHNKYIKLQPDIAAEIDEFYHTHMQTGPILGVQARGGSKLNEDPRWREVIELIPHEIDCYLKDNPTARIFLLTDDEPVLERFKQMYGDLLIYTDCTRKTIYDIEICLNVFPDKRRKGIEIIKDTYLACKCDSFIGNQGSGVTHAISRMKAWDKDKIKQL